MHKKGDTDSPADSPRKADWFTVEAVAPIVEGRDGVPEDDARRFRAWLGSFVGADRLMALVREHDLTRTVMGALAEAYALYIETECDAYAVDLMCRTGTDGDGNTTIAEPPTPGERMARMRASHSTRARIGQ